MRLRLAAALVALSLLAVAVPLYAHHAFAAEFDASKPIAMKGKFIKMDWVNPHSWVHFEVTLPNGQKQVWSAETPPPNQLVRMGWSKTTLEAGDELQVSGSAAKSGAAKMWAGNVTLIGRAGKAIEPPKQVYSFSQNPETASGGLLPAR